MARLAVLFVFFSCYAAALAVNVHGVVQWNDHCRSYAELGHAVVVLDNGVASGSITRDGRPDVEPGVYVASVNSHDHQFDNLRIDVLPEPDALPEVRPYAVGTPLNPPSPYKLGYPIKLTPRKRSEYFVPHEAFNVMGMFQSPMVLMMGFAGIMVLGMPYLMKHMDPETMEDFKETQAKLARFQSSMQTGDLKSSIQALAGTDEAAAGPVTTATTRQANSSSSGAGPAKNRGNKKKRG
ncbi:hypothetical protein FA95DRAFT_1600955 [Auriscalpium vulgare]|uniref:Uncharacterized protein n=1 Tax=Auriscalpium vulgare TaxID=40419 RepID=A0ACB8SAS8_9AGAM|nr:hypothetical protein FA95DRAFT_1600955 [Auriscalpium vulgare]